MTYFPEMNRAEKLATFEHPLFESRILAYSNDNDKKLPIYGFVLGSKNKKLPTFGVTAGVHGLEKIGSHIALHFLECLVEQLKWDEELLSRFEKSRLVCIPIVNPSGVLHNTRSNNQGVDLMRNAPVDAEERAPWFLGGQSISNKLPYFKGDPQSMEIESQALIDFMREELFESDFSMALDIHSGFGARDRLWYPYAKTRRPFPLIHSALQFKNLIDVSFPNHVYKIEAQSSSYITDGDLWDYMFDEHQKTVGLRNKGEKQFIPWCLEMGSWIWVKKNPIQILSPFGMFNPLKPHRYKRMMRRHYILLDFYMRSIQSHKKWINKNG